VTGRQPAVRLRRATEADADLLLAWANDPPTRDASFHSDPIGRAGHVRWLASRLASSTTGFWIGEDEGGRPIGQVRVEVRDEAVGEISISVAPDARGMGFGHALLSAAVDEAPRTLPVERLLARVRSDNPASLALFGGAGFVEIGPGTCAGVPCVELEMRVP
jgi:UDP-2,4-diacetamido-2,4,6-trideoxy-beta-L-altropyranose hydrolase